MQEKETYGNDLGFPTWGMPRAIGTEGKPYCIVTFT